MPHREVTGGGGHQVVDGHQTLKPFPITAAGGACLACLAPCKLFSNRLHQGFASYCLIHCFSDAAALPINA